MPTLISGLLLNTARVPLAVLLSARWGVEGVWYAIAITTVLKAIIKVRASTPHTRMFGQQHVSIPRPCYGLTTNPHHQVARLSFLEAPRVRGQRAGR